MLTPAISVVSAAQGIQYQSNISNGELGSVGCTLRDLMWIATEGRVGVPCFELLL